ncbi:MAG: alpha-glucosidase [Treponema sp.]|jgi:oligo-1,6-glucosidase|nr:alpha-glucosidase [Treponema sp.]
MNKQWWKKAVVYQIYPRSFKDSTGSGVGDLNGITEKLDYLKALGVDVLWLSPIYASPNVDNGYDISDYQAISQEFGSMADFDRLLTAAHERGLKIVMDLVVNHTSNQHKWFVESRSSRENPKRDWYIWRDGTDDGLPPNKLSSIFSGSAWEKDEATGQYYLHLFAQEQPDLNWRNSEVRSAVFSMMKWWLDKGIDGFRMDVINLIGKPDQALAISGKPVKPIPNDKLTHTYLQEMYGEVLSHYDIMTVGETPGVTASAARQFAGFDAGELNMVFQFELMDVDADPKTGKWNQNRYDLRNVKKIMSKWQTELYGAAWNSLYWNNHDQPRVVSRFGDDSCAETRVRSAKMLATCLHLMQGTPYIYQGEELGMTNFPIQSLDDIRDVESLNAYRELVSKGAVFSHEQMMAAIRKSGRDNARTPMQWDKTSNAGFTTGVPWLAVNPNYVEINAEAQTQDPASVFSYYKKLIALRKQYPIIVHGDYDLLLPDDERLFVYQRRFEGKATLLVFCNFSGETVPRPPATGFGRGSLLISNYAETELAVALVQPWEATAYLA